MATGTLDTTSHTMFSDPWEMTRRLESEHNAALGAANPSTSTRQAALDPAAYRGTHAGPASTRHSSVHDSVNSANFLFPHEDPYYYPSSAGQLLQHHQQGGNGQTSNSAMLNPDHRGSLDSYLSVSPRPSNYPVSLAGSSLSMPVPASLSASGSNSRRPVYEPYSALSTSAPAGSSSHGYTNLNLPALQPVHLAAGSSASGTSTIGDLLSSIPHSEGHPQSASPTFSTIPRPPGSNSSLLTVKPFTRKLFDMLSSPELSDLLYWDEPGRAIVICSGHPKFKSQVLQPAFGHSSVQSFHRQLNVYRFKRVDIHSLLVRTLPRCECSAWAHPDYMREGERNLYKLQPRPSKARRLKKERQEIERRRKSSDEQLITYAEQQASLDGSLSPHDFRETPSPTDNDSYNFDEFAHGASLMAAGLVSPAQLTSHYVS